MQGLWKTNSTTTTQKSLAFTMASRLERISIWDSALGLKTKNSTWSRINAPELRGDEKEAGIAARNFLRSQISGSDVIIETMKDKKDKFGRYITEKRSHG